MRIFLATAEDPPSYKNTLKLLEKPNLLMSYYYLRSKIRDPANMHAFLQDASKHCSKLFLDSGAHTFIVQNNLKRYSQGSTVTKHEDPVKYYEDYKAWLKEYAVYFDYIAELDVGEVPGVGYPMVQKWRKELDAMGLHDKLLVVSHYHHFSKIFPKWTDEWERMLDEYHYVAIGDDPPEAILDRHFKIWIDKGKKNFIHGFAETKIWKLLRYPYYSVDSTSWHIGARFGTVLLYHRSPNLAMKTWAVDRQNTKKCYEKFCTSVYPKMEPQARRYPIANFWDYTDGNYFRCYQNALAFQALESDLTKMWGKRGITFPS